MPRTHVLPDPDFLRLEQLTEEHDRVTIFARTSSPSAAYPLCATRSTRVHSRYVRTVADLPWQGLTARLRLTVRRFVCSTPECRRSIFCERIPKIAASYAHATARSVQLQTAVAFVAGGEAGARLSERLAMPVSPDTLLRRIRSAPLAELPTPRVLGVDDFALRRGRRYGTLLVDLEHRRPVDLLGERSSENFAAWLQEHPGVEILSRDRGEHYAQGGRQGAPGAEHVADRFHLLKNLGDAVERFLACRHEDLAAVAATLTAEARSRAADAQCQQPTPAQELPIPVCLEPSRAEREKHASRERRLARYTQVVDLHQKGWSARAVAREIGISRVTVRRYVAAGTFPERAPRVKRAPILAPYAQYLRQRWADGCRNGQRLYAEIAAMGFVGSAFTLRRMLRAWRGEDGRGRWKHDAPAGPAPVDPIRPPSPRRAMWLLLGEAARLDEPERSMRERILETCQAAADVAKLAWEFQAIVRTRSIDAFEEWLDRAKGCRIGEIVNFARGLEQDRPEVEAALRLEWSNGQLEGHVNRLKALKRAMYGRAKPDLLKARVLYRQ